MNNRLAPIALGLLLLSTLACSSKPATRNHPIDGLTYVWIPGGAFAFGCSPDDKDCYEWESAAQPREIKTGFWIGETEVTQRAFKYVLGTNPSLYPGEQRPVDQVSWNDAQRYCQELHMRLPSAVEWEYAARGGITTARHGRLNDIAWYDTNSGDATHEVKQKLPNAFGIYDALGNVWEWIADPQVVDPPQYQRQLRGGAFTGLSKVLRASSLNWAPPETAHRNMGFRCAADELP